MTQSQKWLRARKYDKLGDSIVKICLTVMIVWSGIMSVSWYQFNHPYKVVKMNWSGLDWTKNVKSNLIVYGK